MEAVPILATIFFFVFGGISLMTYVGNLGKVRILQEKRALAEAEARAKSGPPPAALPTPVAADPNAAPVLALKLPEPLRTQAWALLRQLQDAPKTLDARSAYLVKQAQADYLPQTLRSYLELTDGARRRLAAQGMDTETLIAEQLTLIDSGVQEALRLDHAAADRLLTQGRFLRERFQDAAPTERGELVSLEKT
ncbi:hypothetical protein [Deinococcus sp.]|uniref:hypothetical protein n=1 Tax=Deinococcus sp. TaxID=47478 RepID=UPI003B5A5372